MVKYFKTLFIVLFAAVLFAGNLQAADDITSKNSIDFNKINKKLEQIDDNLKKENLKVKLRYLLKEIVMIIIKM